MALHLVRVDAVGLRAGDELVGVAYMTDWLIGTALSLATIPASLLVAWWIQHRQSLRRAREPRMLRLLPSPMAFRIPPEMAREQLAILREMHAHPEVIRAAEKTVREVELAASIRALKSESEEGS